MDSLNNMGVLLPTRGVLVYARGGRPRVELNWQMAETAERIGYDSVWVGDSITSKPRLEPLAVMAALAARTYRVKIGTAVMLNALRHPVHLAHAIATIDNISGGRVVLGLGAGRSNNQMFVDEHAIVGIPIAERAARMEESIDVLRKLWTQDDASNAAGFYPFEGVNLEPKPVQQQVPIWLSSNWVRRGLKRVAAQGDGWITNVPSTELFTKCWGRIEEQAKELGRDIRGLKRCLYISVNLNEEADALEEGDQFMRAYYSTPYEVISKQLL
ncbi:MAG: LLM class flavin-dependent oxidoreductase, partial [Chloroflexi bacterium]|nr:LLM class flavin-dependent oxidoreductase [Chloroflexota bacterium]